jgi:putative transposase
MPDGYRSRNQRVAITSRLRLRNHDYKQPDPYFVTLCTEYRQTVFGSIRDSVMYPSDAGHMVNASWAGIPERFPSVAIYGHVIMPNHLHGIIVLTGDGPDDPGASHPSLSDVVHWLKRRTIRGYAAGVKNEGWPPYHDRLWQRGFMDHIIRNDREWERLHTYMENNVAQWEDDVFHAR